MNKTSGSRDKNRQAAAGTMAIASALTAITREITDMLQIAPARGAASILLMIFDTVEGIHVNKSDCLRLARRCSQLLLDIHSAMDGRWKDAPPTLLSNLNKLEKTLSEIHAFMVDQAAVKWHSRMFKKREIDIQIQEYTALLEDATTAFQVATLVTVHHTIGQRPQHKYPDIDDAPPPYDAKTNAKPSYGLKHSRRDGPAEQGNVSCEPRETSETLPVFQAGPEDNDKTDEPLTPIPVHPKSASTRDADSESLPNSSTSGISSYNSPQATQVQPEVHSTSLIHKHRQCHQTELKIMGRSRIKEGWWAGAVEVELDGKLLLLKRYDGPTEEAGRLWREDITFLEEAQHSTFPQICCVSYDTAVTPFLVLNQARTQSLPIALRNKLKDGDSTYLSFITSVFQDLAAAADYIQHHCNVLSGRLTSFFQQTTYRIGEGNRIIIAPLPYPSSIPFTSSQGIIDVIRDLLLTQISSSSCFSEDGLQRKGIELVRQIYHQLLESQE